jgi:hypothetical protein
LNEINDCLRVRVRSGRDRVAPALQICVWFAAAVASGARGFSGVASRPLLLMVSCGAGDGRLMSVIVVRR